jgi:hypothetical protein
MGHVLLWHLDGRLPNLALMRIAAHHRALGDTVELRRGTPSRLLWDQPTHVYGSLLFTRSRPLGEQLRMLYPAAVLGGTGWDATGTLGQVGIPETGPLDYTIYPDYPHSIGFTQRGCRLHCPFCVVPRKEGRVQPVATIAAIWRGAPWPKTILLLDNDVLGQPDWAERLEEIRTGQFQVCFTQGINVRLLTEDAAQALARVHFMDDQFRRRRLYTAWDNRRDEARLFAGLERLVRHGVLPDAIMVYLLIGYWPGETEADWLYRQARLRAFGARPYPMPYVRTPATVGFQRWCVGAYDKRIPWAQWQAAGYRPERVYARQEDTRDTHQIALPLWPQGSLASPTAPEAFGADTGEENVDAE